MKDITRILFQGEENSKSKNRCFSLYVIYFRSFQKLIRFYKFYFFNCRYPDSTFRRHFRMSRESVENLCLLLSRSLHVQKKSNRGKPMVELRKQVLIHLWYISTNEVLRTISDRFDQIVWHMLHSCVQSLTSACDRA